MMDAQISATQTTATSGLNGVATATARGAKRCSARPAAIGASTTCSVDRSIAGASTATSAPASWAVRAGVKTTAAAVEMVVSATLRATFARAMYVTTLDAVPPGQHETRMRPTANGVGSASSLPTA